MAGFRANSIVLTSKKKKKECYLQQISSLMQWIKCTPFISASWNKDDKYNCTLTLAFYYCKQINYLVNFHSVVQVQEHTCLMSSGLLSMCEISGLRSIRCCICGLATIICLIRSGLDIMLCTSGFSMIWDSISGLDMSCRCICCWSSMKLADPIPRLDRPERSPNPAENTQENQRQTKAK